MATLPMKKFFVFIAILSVLAINGAVGARAGTDYWFTYLPKRTPIPPSGLSRRSSPGTPPSSARDLRFHYLPKGSVPPSGPSGGSSPDTPPVAGEITSTKFHNNLPKASNPPSGSTPAGTQLADEWIPNLPKGSNPPSGSTPAGTPLAAGEWFHYLPKGTPVNPSGPSPVTPPAQ